MCYTEGILRSKQADDRRGIHFGHQRDHQSILVTLSTWWCGCIQIVRKISFPTTFVRKGPPWRTYSNLECPPNPENQPYPVESDEDSAPENILDTEDWLNWNGDLDNPNDSEDDCAADVESDMDQDNGIEDPESPEQQDVSAMPNVPGLIRPIRKSKRHA
jgi:hypothetical protein